MQREARESTVHPDRPRRLNGEYKKCGSWVVELFDESGMWKSIAFRDVRNKRDAEKRLALLIGDRERGSLRLPKENKCTNFSGVL